MQRIASKLNQESKRELKFIVKQKQNKNLKKLKLIDNTVCRGMIFFSLI